MKPTTSNPLGVANPSFSVQTTTPQSTVPVTSTPTVISNADVVSKTIPQNSNKLATATKNTGLIVGADGQSRYANGTMVDTGTKNADGSKTLADGSVIKADGSLSNYKGTPVPTFGIDTGMAPNGEVKQFKDAQGNAYSVDNNGNIVAGPSNGQYQVGSNISQYSDAYKTITGKDIPQVGSTGTNSSPSGDPTVDKLMGQLDDLKTKMDATTTSQIQNIQQQYESLINEQRDANTRQEKSVTQSLLLGGSTRYAQTSSAGIIHTQVSAGISKIADLQAKEQNAILQAQQAQNDGDYRIVDRLLSEAEAVRKDKAAEISKVNETLAKANADIRAKQVQSARDDVVANAMASGITDPKTLLETLNKNGGSYTAEELGKTVKSLADAAGTTSDAFTGDMKEYFALKQAGIALPSSIASLPASQQPYAYIKYKADLTRKETAATTDKSYSITTDQRGQLLGAGLSNDQVTHIQQGINDYGLTTVLEKETGLTDSQKKVLTQIVTNKAQEFIDKKYITATFSDSDLKKAAKDAGDTTGGFFGLFKSGDTSTYVDALLEQVQAYRDEGYSDKEIADKLSKKING